MGGVSNALGLKHSNSHSSNQSSNTMWDQGGNLLAQLFQKALENLNNNQYQSNIYQAGQHSNDQRDRLFNQMMGSGDSTAYRATTPYGLPLEQSLRDNLMQPTGRSNMGAMYENIVGGPGNTYIDPMIQSMRQDAADNYHAFQGDNSFDAMMHGASGGSRQAMTDAIAQRQMNQDLTSREAQMRQGNYDRDMAMKMAIARNADTNIQADRDRSAAMLDRIGGSNLNLYNMDQNQNNIRNQQLMQLIGNYQNPYMNTQQSMWNPYMNVRNIFGNPVMEQRASGNASGHMFDFQNSNSANIDPSALMALMA